jgi:5'(3')-deoxyribonucleotidase
MRIAINLEDIKNPQGEVIDAGTEAVKRLLTKHSVLVLYTPSTDDIKTYSENALWVRSNLGSKILKDFIITQSRTLILCDFLIDSKSYDKYRGNHIHLYGDDFPKWNYALKYLGV